MHNRNLFRIILLGAGAALASGLALAISGPLKTLYLPGQVGGMSSAALSNYSPNTSVGSLSIVRVFPNPWRADKHAGITHINFDQMTPGATVKIFTISARHVKTLTADAAGVALWDMTNDSGQRVASDVYLYVVTDSQGQKARGELSIIR